MNSPRRLAVLGVATACLVGGCTTTGRLSIESSAPRGQRPQVFTASELPVFAVTSDERYFSALKIRRKSDGVTVWRVALADFYASDPDLAVASGTGDLEQPASWRPLFSDNGQSRITGPWLPEGDYLVELWVRGKAVSTERMEVTGSRASASAAAASQPPTRAPVSFFSVGRSGVSRATDRMLDRDVAALDAVVGLTREQRAAVRKIYAHGYEAVAGRAGVSSATVRAAVEPSIRALLTPAQQSLYADDGSAFRAQWLASLSPAERTRVVSGDGTFLQPEAGVPDVAARRLERRLTQLDRLVHLSASQRATASNIFSEEDRALAAFAAGRDRAVLGEPIRRKARADIQALLTAEQRQIYDSTPQRLGGGSYRDPELHARNGIGEGL